MLGRTGRFRRADRILCSRSFARALRMGRRRSSEGFVVVVAPAEKRVDRGESPARARLGVTVSRKVGNAVVRNRVKRLIREWFRRARADLPARSDTVVIARRAARGLSGPEVTAVLDGMVASLPPGGAR